MMTLSSQPTLMPSRTESNGIAPALKNAPNSTERQHAIVEEAAGKDQPGDADQHEQHAGQRLGDAEKSSIKPLPRVGEQQQQHAGRDHRSALESAARRQVAVHDDVGRKDRDQRHENLRAGPHDFAGLPRWLRRILERVFVAPVRVRPAPSRRRPRP